MYLFLCIMYHYVREMFLRLYIYIYKKIFWQSIWNIFQNNAVQHNYQDKAGVSILLLECKLWNIFNRELWMKYSMCSTCNNTFLLLCSWPDLYLGAYSKDWGEHHINPITVWSTQSSQESQVRKHSRVMQGTFTVRMKRWWKEATDGFALGNCLTF